MIRKQHDKIIECMAEVETEIIFAINKYPKFNSAHEGYAVLLEEVDELWDEIKKRQEQRNKIAMKQEAVQIAAMAIRLIVDLT